MKERISKIIREHSKKLVELYYNDKPEWIEAAEKDFINAIKKELLPQWIPVSERLPEEYSNCLFLIDSDTEFDYVKGFYFNDEHATKKVISGNEIIALDKISYWMPESELIKLLPEEK